MKTGAVKARSRRLIILGSTGSIGVSTLEVVEHLRRERSMHVEVIGLAAGANEELLLAQAQRHGARHVAIAAPALKGSMTGSRATIRRFTGEGAAVELIHAVAQPGDMVLGAMVGAAGIPAMIAAIERGCDIALANKETLVAAGAIVLPLVRARDVRLIPLDSEHSAVFQCLQAGRSIDEIRRVVITASGGPFRTTPLADMADATVDQALQHPTWRMGRKITIDSATMMNKALEVIEAHWLFGLAQEQIEVVIHPQSLVHGFVEFIDGSVVAQLSPPDMRTPIQYALTWPERHLGCGRRIDWSAARRMEFEPLDSARFPAVKLAHQAISRGGTAGATLNAANEVAVQAFLAGEIRFGEIVPLVEASLAALPTEPVGSLGDVLQADARARDWARERIAGRREGGGRPALGGASAIACAVPSRSVGVLPLGRGPEAAC